MTDFKVDNLVVNTINGAAPGGGVSLAGDAEGVDVGGVITTNLTTPNRTMRAALTAGIANPTTGMTFKQTRQARAIEPQAPALPALSDHFTQDVGSYSITGTGTSAWVNGTLQLVGNGDSRFCVHASTCDVPATCVSVYYAAQGTGGSFNSCYVGFVRGLNSTFNSLLAVWEETSGDLYLASSVSGVFGAIGAKLNMTQPASFGMMLQVSGETALLWLDLGHGWIPFITRSLTGIFDISSDPTEFSNWHPCFSVFGGTSTPWILSKFEQGYLGQNFLRDFRPVVLRDGTPYAIGRWNYFTATGDCCGVYRIDFSTGQIEKTGILIFIREGGFKFDLNANLIYDETINAWRVISTSYGGSSMGEPPTVRMEIYRGEVLHGVRVIPAGTILNLASRTTGDDCHDPSVMYDVTNARWLVAYTIARTSGGVTDWIIALDSSPDLVTFTSLFADNTGSTGVTEGSSLARIGGAFYVFGANGVNYPVWDTTGSLVGTMNATPYASPGGNPPPHFIVFSVPQGDVTNFYALSWQNTRWIVDGADQGIFAVGTTILFKAAETETGFENGRAVGIQ